MKRNNLWQLSQRPLISEISSEITNEKTVWERDRKKVISFSFAKMFCVGREKTGKITKKS